MPYTRQQWTDRAVEQPHRYRKVGEDAELVTLLPEPGNVVQEGTAITAARMNYIEKGIEDAHEAAKEAAASAVRADSAALADSATKLTTARTFRVNLASNSVASFDGTENATPGVEGVLGIQSGGGGAGTAEGIRKNLELKSGAQKEIQTGSVSVTTTAGATVLVPITFPVDFSGTPKVTPVIQTGSPHLRWATPTGITNKGCTLNVRDEAATGGTYTVGWTAIY